MRGRKYNAMSYGEVIEALAPPMRRAIFEKLRAGPMSVGAIADGMPVSRPAVSQHLRVLKGARLVSERAEGPRRIYAVDERGLRELRAYLDQFWDDALASFKASLEEGETP